MREEIDNLSNNQEYFREKVDKLLEGVEDKAPTDEFKKELVRIEKAVDFDADYDKKEFDKMKTFLSDNESESPKVHHSSLPCNCHSTFRFRAGARLANCEGCPQCRTLFVKSKFSDTLGSSIVLWSGFGAPDEFTAPDMIGRTKAKIKKINDQTVDNVNKKEMAKLVIQKWIDNFTRGRTEASTEMKEEVSDETVRTRADTAATDTPLEKPEPKTRWAPKFWMIDNMDQKSRTLAEKKGTKTLGMTELGTKMIADDCDGINWCTASIAYAQAAKTSSKNVFVLALQALPVHVKDAIFCRTERYQYDTDDNFYVIYTNFTYAVCLNGTDDDCKSAATKSARHGMKKMCEDLIWYKHNATDFPDFNVDNLEKACAISEDKGMQRRVTWLCGERETPGSEHSAYCGDKADADRIVTEIMT
eukprot:g1451.t1